MAKTKISEFSSTPANNTDIDSINIAEGCAPSNINDAIRELMAQLKDFQTGAQGDSFNGPMNGTIGATTAYSGAFTTLSASGTTTLSGLTASTALALDASKNVVSVANTGSGSNVLATSPTLVTPALGTPSSATLTNATGLPISTGVSGLGTGVATALAVNVGSAGAPVVNGGALGTPSSGTVTNLTGTASININGTVGATTPTTGAFTTMSASSSVTLSGGTANGVTYLNGSKVLTSGSALTFDGTNFATTGNISAGTNKSISLNASSTTDVTRLKWNYDGTTYAWIERVNNSGDMAFGVQSSEGMRLTSTGLGIGTSSPAAKLDVAEVNFANIARFSRNITGTNSIGAATRIRTSTTGDMTDGFGTAIVFSIEDSAAVQNDIAFINAVRAGADNTGALTFSTSSAGTSSERARIDSSGNLGLGVTPSAWSLLKALQVGTASFAGYSNTTYVGSNVYFDGSVYRYIGADRATLYTLNNSAGQHQWSVSASGSAGAQVTFTQAMTLDASGNLAIGTTTAYSKVYGKQSSALQNGFMMQASANDMEVRLFHDGTIAGVASSYRSTAGYSPLTFWTSDTEQARIDSSGNLLVGRTSAIASERLSVEGSNTSFISRIRNTSATTPSGVFVSYTAAAPNDTGNSFFRADDNAATRAEIRSNGGIANYSANNVNLSDVRTKTDIQNAGGYLAKICAIPVRTFKYKDQTDDLLNLGVIAQEVEAVAPELVDVSGFGETPEDGVPLKAIYQTDLQYALMKALQELKAEFDAYKASHP